MAAYISLQKLGLAVEVETVTSDTVTKDYVISAVPAAGEKLNEGDTVYLTVSGGPEIKYVQMPELTGRSSTTAQSILESMNLTVGSITAIDDEAPAGEVIFQSIAAGTEVAEHTKVNLNISNGAKMTPEPTPTPTPEPDNTPSMEPTTEPDPEESREPTPEPTPEGSGEEDENAVTAPEVNE